MPNYCSNVLEAKWRRSDITQLKKALVKNGSFTFQWIHPLPKELEWTRSPARIVPNGTNKYEFVLKEYPFLSDPERVKNNTPEERHARIKKEVSELLTDSESKSLIKKFWTNNRYDWQVANRWTKRDACDANVFTSKKTTQFAVWFDTAWSPPEEWFSKLCKCFPNIEFSMEYEEPGMAFEWTMHSDWEWWYRNDSREYVSRCDCCDEKKEDVERYDNLWESLCESCLQDWAYAKCDSCEDRFNEDEVSNPPSWPCKCEWCRAE